MLGPNNDERKGVVLTTVWGGMTTMAKVEVKGMSVLFNGWYYTPDRVEELA
jgi:hypothetical protein